MKSNSLLPGRYYKQRELLRWLVAHQGNNYHVASPHCGALTHTSSKPVARDRRLVHAAPAAVTSPSPALVQQQALREAQHSAFDNHKLAYGHRSLPYLIRAYFVLQLCRIQRLTRNASRWAQLGARVLGKRMFGTVMRASFFGHFTGAEDTARVRECVKCLYSTHNIRPILHYHAERELGECKNAQQRAEAVKSNAELTLESMKIVSEAAPSAFAAIKITAFFDPQVLAKLKSTITTICLLQNIGADARDENRKICLSSQEAKQLLHELLPSRNEPTHMQVFRMMQNVVQQKQSLENLSILNAATKSLPEHSPLFHQRARPGTFSGGELEEFLASWQQLLHILDTAEQFNVRLFIDAEQTWLQPAIAQLALLAMHRCNKKEAANVDKDISPRIWTTLQCYLKDAEQTYCECTDIADRENFVFATKLVRGAYIRSETERANSMQYDCAIWPTYEQTNDNYDKLADTALRRVVNSGNCSGLQVAFATHNEKSIEKILNRMSELKIDTDQVAFGQLYGMCDRITYDLAYIGYTVLKVVPYGPIPLLTPYFVRRAEENSLMLGRCEKDLQMLKLELAQRLSLGNIKRKVAQA